MDSRTGPTRALATLAAGSAGRLRAFVTASAVGFYGADRGDEVLTEDSERGDGFLADVAAAWEAAAAPAAAAGIRSVRVRTGIVQTPAGGVLRLLYPLFAAGLGGPLGDGTEWQPWIEIDDLLDVYLRAVTDPALAGPVNAVAPGEVRNAGYARALGRVLRRPALVPVPAAGPRLLLGAEGARELAAASQRVRPAALAAAGPPVPLPGARRRAAARARPRGGSGQGRASDGGGPVTGTASARHGVPQPERGGKRLQVRLPGEPGQLAVAGVVAEDRDGDAQRVGAAPVGVDPRRQVGPAGTAQVPADAAERVLQGVGVAAPGRPGAQRREEQVPVGRLGHRARRAPGRGHDPAGRAVARRVVREQLELVPGVEGDQVTRLPRRRTAAPAAGRRRRSAR